MNSRHPDSRRVWKGGSRAHLLRRFRGIRGIRGRVPGRQYLITLPLISAKKSVKLAPESPLGTFAPPGVPQTLPAVLPSTPRTPSRRPPDAPGPHPGVPRPPPATHQPQYIDKLPIHRTAAVMLISFIQITYTYLI